MRVIRRRREWRRWSAARNRGGFSLVELLAVGSIVAVLAGLTGPALVRARGMAKRTGCVSNLHQLGVACSMYWDDHAGRAFRYRTVSTGEGVRYWFGWLATGAEGDRNFDARAGALFPYLCGRGVELCPAWGGRDGVIKLKARGNAYGYGYNLALSAPPAEPEVSVHTLTSPARLAALADAAQVNTFQAPASKDRPMLEEFYYVSGTTREKTAHFRHGEKAGVLFCDGHVGLERAEAGSYDERLPRERVGRLPAELLLAR